MTPEREAIARQLIDVAGWFGEDDDDDEYGDWVTSLRRAAELLTHRYPDSEAVA